MSENKSDRYSSLFVEYFGWVIYDDTESIGEAETEESAINICNALNAKEELLAYLTGIKSIKGVMPEHYYEDIGKLISKYEDEKK